jgi:hypothetical protein
MTNKHSAITTIATTDLDSVVGGVRDPGGSCDDGSGTGAIGEAPPGSLPSEALGQSSAPRSGIVDPLGQPKPAPGPALHVGKPR